MRVKKIFIRKTIANVFRELFARKGYQRIFGSSFQQKGNMFPERSRWQLSFWIPISQKKLDIHERSRWRQLSKNTQQKLSITKEAGWHRKVAEAYQLRFLQSCELAKEGQRLDFLVVPFCPFRELFVDDVVYRHDEVI